SGHKSSRAIAPMRTRQGLTKHASSGGLAHVRSHRKRHDELSAERRPLPRHWCLLEGMEDNLGLAGCDHTWPPAVNRVAIKPHTRPPTASGDRRIGWCCAEIELLDQGRVAKRIGRPFGGNAPRDQNVAAPAPRPRRHSVPPGPTERAC